MKVVNNPVKRQSIFENSVIIDDQFVKAVIDVQKEVIVYDAGMHIDLEQYLLSQGSSQENLWGINLLKDINGDAFVEFDSMINIRPRQNNRTRAVEDPKIRSKILDIINKLLI